MSKRAEQRALEAYPEQDMFRTSNHYQCKHRKEKRRVYREGYRQAEKDIIALVKQYIEKGERCMEQEGESQIYAFWDGFHNCAENFLRELDDEK